MCLVRYKASLHAFPIYLISLVVKATLVIETDHLKGFAQLKFILFSLYAEWRLVTIELLSSSW